MPKVVGGWPPVQAVFQKILEKPILILPPLSSFRDPFFKVPEL
jgi:hypothetical protein